MEMDVASDWETFPLPSFIKQKLCKSALQAVLLGHTKWESVRLHEPPQCELEAGVLVWTNILCHTPMKMIDGGYDKRF